MTSNSLLDQAIHLQQKGQHDEASVLYKQLLQHDPLHIEVLGYLGLAYVALGHQQLAFDTLEHALTIAPADIGLHMHAANACKRFNQIDKAIHHYQQILKHHPHYAKAHNNLAAIYAADNNYQLALRYYRDALHCDPSLLPAHLNLGLLLLKHHELVAAEKQFHNVLALDPDHQSAYFYLALLHIEANRLDEAEVFLQRLLYLAPSHVDAWVNRGVIALKQGREQQAVDYFTQALILDNDHLEARNNLAATFIYFDRYEQALQYYDELLRENPSNIEYLYNSGIAQMGLGHVQIAITLFQRVLTLQRKHFGALSNLAAIQMRVGNRPLACDLLERALEVQPHDATSRFMLQALRGDTNPTLACPEYAHDLFNHYALYYDKHMEQQLQYAVPKRLWTILHERSLLSYQKGLDLGCGTGLSGMILKPHTQHLTGVDIASKMLVVAKEKAIYDDLVEAELLGYLQHADCVFDVAVAADVLPYFGDLSPLFEAIKPRLAKDAIFWFTTEISHTAPWVLQPSIRFCHHPDYMKELCTRLGFTIIHQETMVARKQENNDLYVILYGIQAN